MYILVPGFEFECKVAKMIEIRGKTKILGQTASVQCSLCICKVIQHLYVPTHNNKNNKSGSRSSQPTTKESPKVQHKVIHEHLVCIHLKVSTNKRLKTLHLEVTTDDRRKSIDRLQLTRLESSTSIQYAQPRQHLKVKLAQQCDHILQA